MADDVSLDLRSSGFNRVSARPQIRIGPLAIVESEFTASFQLRKRPQYLLCYLLEALVQLAPEEFLDGALRPGSALVIHTADGPNLVEAHDFDFGVDLRQLLTNHRVT